jgi:class 3 adenylate cyclase/DNA-binding response OmpR family regulator/predicted ATPase
MRKRILVASRRMTLRASMARALQSAGYSVELAETRKRAVELVKGGLIDAAIIIPDDELGGLTQELRGRVPSVVLENPSNGISIGREVLQRLGELTPMQSRTGNPKDATHVVQSIDDCTFDPAARAFHNAQGHEAHLTRAESALLAAFAGSPRRVLSRDQLRRAVAGHGAEPYERSIDMLVARLRRKIEQDPKVPRIILTMPGEGYQLAARASARADAKSGPDIEEQQRQAAQATEFSRGGGDDSTLVRATRDQVTAAGFEPERRQLTAFSCRLVGSATLASKLDPEDASEVVHRFHELCTIVIAQWGGTLIQAVDSDVLALFGYPQSHEDNSERAVHAALDLLAKVRNLSSPSDEALQARIGLATGLVLVGHDRPIVGEAIRLAPRLCSQAPSNSIVIADEVRRQLRDVFACERIGSSEFEEFSKPITTYRVLEGSPAESRFLARRTKTPTRFVGRQREFDQLSALWERVKGREGQVALVCGEAGIGKSRLCEAFLAPINPHHIRRFQCSPYYSNSPFYPVINQLQFAARFAQQDTPEIKLRKLEAILSPVSASRIDIPVFAELLSVPVAPAHSTLDITPQRKREFTITALIRHLLGLSFAHPIVLELADAHWIDSSTLELLDRCIASIKAAPVLILVSFRPEFFPHWLDHSHVTMLRLNRLSREDTGAIVSDVAGCKALPCELTEQIIAKTDGVPLFAEELTKTVIESATLRNIDDLDPNASPRTISIPTTLLDSLTERLDRLGASREIAQIGAAIGREFSYRLLAVVASIPVRTLDSALAHLAACELIFARGKPPDASYIFKHALVRDAAYASLLRSKRQQLHSRIAEALPKAFPQTIETQPELLAHHLAQAGLNARAVETLQSAARRAIENSANAEAIAHLTRALALLTSLPEKPERDRLRFGSEVLLAQARIARHGYAAPQTRETLIRAKSLIDERCDPADRFTILYGLWACYYVGGEVAKQRDAAIEFLREAERHSDTAALCIAHRVLGTTYVTMGEFAASLPHLERARALYDPQKHAAYRYQCGQDIGVAALCYLSWAYWHLGRADQALRIATEAMQQAESLGHPHTLVYTICHAGAFVDLFRRCSENTKRYADAVVSLCTENGFTHWINCGRIFEGWTAADHGEADRASENIRAGVLGWKDAGARLWMPIFLTLQAQARAKAGRNEAALRDIDEALVICETAGERWAVAEILRVKAWLLGQSGGAQVDEIETLLLKSLELARRQQARCWELRVACDLARLWQDQSQCRRALKLLRSVYDQFTEGFDTPDLREARVIIDELKRNQDRSKPPSRNRKPINGNGFVQVQRR